MEIDALADYFSQDGFLAYVELGSLGFWGEWHARDSEGHSMMPSAQTCWDYVLAYSNQFQNVRFLVRRSYVQAVEAELGPYNDVLGDRAQTDRWLDWTVNGESQDTLGESLSILPYEAFWETAPVGGELVTTVTNIPYWTASGTACPLELRSAAMTATSAYCCRWMRRTAGTVRSSMATSRISGAVCAKQSANLRAFGPIDWRFS